MSREKRRNSNNVLLRVCKKTLFALVLIGIPAVLFLYTFNIKKIEVVGADRYTNEQIKELVFQSKADSNSLYLYLKYRFFDKTRLPFVEKIDVNMVDNHSVTIFVYEKMVAGCVEFMGEYLYFDKDGIVVESTTEKLQGVPVIKGLKFKEIILNEKLKVQKDETLKEDTKDSKAQGDQSSSETTQAASTQSGVQDGNTKDEAGQATMILDNDDNTEQTDKIFDTIINLTQQIGKQELAVDTITFNLSNEVTLECDEITVLLGKKDSYDEALAELKNILKEAGGMAIILDMRNYEKGTDSYIAKPKKTTE